MSTPCTSSRKSRNRPVNGSFNFVSREEGVHVVGFHEYDGEQPAIRGLLTPYGFASHAGGTAGRHVLVTNLRRVELNVDRAAARTHLLDGVALAHRTGDLAKLSWLVDSIAVAESQAGRARRAATIQARQSECERPSARACTAITLKMWRCERQRLTRPTR